MRVTFSAVYVFFILINCSCVWTSPGDIPKYRKFSQGESSVAVVFLSGGPGCSSYYLDTIARDLSKMADVSSYVLNLRGTTCEEVEVSETEDIAINDELLFISNSLSDIKEDTVVLVGHSFGGILALAYLSLDDNRIHTVVTVGTPGVTYRKVMGYTKTIRKFSIDQVARKDNYFLLPQDKRPVDFEEFYDDLLTENLYSNPSNYYDKYKPIFGDKMCCNLKLNESIAEDLMNNPISLKHFSTVKIISIIGEDEPFDCESLDYKVDSCFLITNSKHLPWMENEREFLNVLNGSLPPDVVSLPKD